MVTIPLPRGIRADDYPDFESIQFVVEFRMASDDLAQIKTASGPRHATKTQTCQSRDFMGAGLSRGSARSSQTAGDGECATLGFRLLPHRMR